jgi:hypothetical protein
LSWRIAQRYLGAATGSFHILPVRGIGEAADDASDISLSVVMAIVTEHRYSWRRPELWTPVSWRA